MIEEETYSYHFNQYPRFQYLIILYRRQQSPLPDYAKVAIAKTEEGAINAGRYYCRKYKTQRFAITPLGWEN